MVFQPLPLYPLFAYLVCGLYIVYGLFNMLRKILSYLRELFMFIRGVQRALIENSVSALEEEYIELETAFLLMVLGPLVGLKTITPLLSLELLEVASSELKVLESRAFKGEDVLGDLMASLGGEW